MHKTARQAMPNRFIGIGERLATAFQGDPEYRTGDKMIIIMHDETVGGTTLDGYGEAEHEAIQELFDELSRICEHNGARLVIVPKDAG